MRFNKFVVEVSAELSVSYDGLALGVFRTDESAMSPEDAWRILQTLAGEPKVESLPPKQGKAPKSKTPADLDVADKVQMAALSKVVTPAFEPPVVPAACVPVEEPAAPVVETASDPSVEQKAEHAAIQDSVQADVVGQSEAGDVPDTVLQAFRIKDVVGYFLDKGFNPDNIWLAIEPYKDTIPALKRLPNPEERVLRVAAAYY